jgi:hypothetical protein
MKCVELRFGETPVEMTMRLYLGLSPNWSGPISIILVKAIQHLKS